MMRTYLKTPFFRYSPLLFLLAALILLSTGMQQAKGASPEGESDKAKFAVLGGYWESEKQGECVVYRAEGSNFFIVNSTYDGLYGTLSGELDSMTFRFAKEYADSLANPQATAEVRKKFMDYLLGTFRAHRLHANRCQRNEKGCAEYLWPEWIGSGPCVSIR